MYETNFGFKDRPFTVSPSPSCFFSATEHQKVLDELLITISSLNGISILTGDAGTGKTAICQQIIIQLKSQFQIQFVEHCNFPTVRALLQTLHYELTDAYEKVSEQELRLALNAEIRSSYLKHDQPLLVIVDEAHLLSAPFLEELRVLSDISVDGKPAFQLMLCGQTNLEETLVQPGLSSLNQRIGCQVFLDRMTRQESEAYIEYRIQRVTAEERTFFSDDAIKLITQVSDGLPRCLNQICDHSLMLAFIQGLPIVDESIAREAFSDLQQLPLHWNEPLQASTPLEQIQSDDVTSHSDSGILDESNEYEIDSSMDDRLNQLIKSPSNEPQTGTDDFDWDSTDLLSLGDETEAIEIGSQPSLSESFEDQNRGVEIESDVNVLQEDSQITFSDSDESQAPETDDGFVEIVDRYAAIDAGLDLSTLSREKLDQAETTDIPKLQPPQFHTNWKPFLEEDPLAKQPSLNSEPNDIESLPPIIKSESEVYEVVSSDSLDVLDDQSEHSDQNIFQALAHEISGGEDTLDRLLASQVYEVCAETRKGLLNALHDISSYSDSSEINVQIPDLPVYDMVRPDDEEEIALESTQLMESDSEYSEKIDRTATASFRLDSQSTSEKQQSATSHLKGPALGRYKNLFSRLRHKQKTN